MLSRQYLNSLIFCVDFIIIHHNLDKNKHSFCSAMSTLHKRLEFYIFPFHDDYDVN